MWRPIKKEDIALGTAIRQDDSHFSTTIIIAILPNNNVRLSRPFAYARELGNSNTPLMSCETFDLNIDSLLSERSEWQVFTAYNSDKPERYVR